jgi:hypothetical protein
MRTETENNTQEIAQPPLPPAAVFDAQHMAEARPVQPLSERRSRKLADAFQHLAGRRLATIAPIIAAVIICVGIGAASVDLAPGALSEKDDPAQAASESLVPSTAMTRSMESGVNRTAQKRRTLSSPQARETLPPLEFSEADDESKAPCAVGFGDSLRQRYVSQPVQSAIRSPSLLSPSQG